MMGSFKDSKFKLICCTGQSPITIEVVMQKQKHLKVLIIDNFFSCYLRVMELCTIIMELENT